MIEPEVAFLELDGLLSLAEGFITHIVTRVLELHRADLKVMGKDVPKLEAVIAPGSGTNNEVSSRPERSVVEGPAVGSATEPGAPSSPAHLRAKVGGGATEPNRFPRLTYDEAHAMLEQAYAEGKIENPHKYGDDFGSPDETYISSQFSKPVMIHRYPAAIKAFYMQPDPADPTKALCVDVLAPEP